MLIDTQILYTQILNLNQRSVKGLSNLDLWSRVVDLDSRPFKQTKGKGFVIKQNFASRKGGRQQKAKVLDEDVPYVDSLAPIGQKCLEDRCMLVDPGRSDLLFCMHEYSEPNANELKKKKYRRIRETLVSQFPNVKTAQEKLSQHPISVNDLIVTIYGKQQAYLGCYRISMRTRRQTYQDTLFSENCASQPISINAKQILDWREP
ncbi:uncharacterized protein BYT42DRAFT_574371 [Radiomyces spectabilis]|uniref:uncharacterized protein n=1 Tax=Radiomyces spectabilis TaxID=64574 RepID=UPI00222128D9|nr:uncharacterized protein BYT42DRAFT_574371 [Radiomyces spectabilis]KAI8376372.1 hypothetical protein BYT42DRAFT_574371 [Radiomyces spectabilis]